jgi:hypothetical protein
MNQLHSFPVTAENGSRYWVALNFEPKRKRTPVALYFVGAVSLYLAIHLIIWATKGFSI